MSAPRFRLNTIVALSILCGATPAIAGSKLVLPLPSRYGDVAATTYDRTTGEILGDGFVRLVRLGAEGVRMEAESRIDGGARTRLTADLATLPDGSGLRLLRQESRSMDGLGKPLGVLEIDHLAGEGRCTGPSLDGKPPATETVALPEDDRLVNVPLNLLFQPLARGEAQELKFQVLLCGRGARIVTAVARVVEPETPPADDIGLMRIQYELSLPKLLARMVKRWLPNLSFWFDPTGTGTWVGNEMPLFDKGPTVLVLRDDLTPASLRQP